MFLAFGCVGLVGWWVGILAECRVSVFSILEMVGSNGMKEVNIETPRGRGRGHK